MQVVPELVERNFGDYELQSDANYARVWEADMQDLSARPPGDGESVQQEGTFHSHASVHIFHFSAISQVQPEDELSMRHLCTYRISEIFCCYGAWVVETVSSAFHFEAECCGSAWTRLASYDWDGWLMFCRQSEGLSLRLIHYGLN